MCYYSRPFQESDKISNRLKLPEGWKIHNAFHVSLLRPFVGDELENMVLEEQPEGEELEEILVLEHILAHKDRKVRGKVARHYLNLNKKSPMEYINEIAPIPVEGRVVACDGGHDLLGHPVEYISLDSEEPNVCKYCGLRYVQAHHKHH
ncbi:hypothetical protein L7F22_005453 [Adiantum nelumboides]|nr:hypothetical protein [Adiantum nelumboides]